MWAASEKLFKRCFYGSRRFTKKCYSKRVPTMIHYQRASRSYANTRFFFLSFNRGFPLKMVPEGFQVEVYVGPRLGRRLGGLLERSWEGFGRPRCVPRRPKMAPRRLKMAPRRFRDGQECRQDALQTRCHASRWAKDSKMERFTTNTRKQQNCVVCLTP